MVYVSSQLPISIDYVNYSLLAGIDFFVLILGALTDVLKPTERLSCLSNLPPFSDLLVLVAY